MWNPYKKIDQENTCIHVAPDEWSEFQYDKKTCPTNKRLQFSMHMHAGQRDLMGASSVHLMLVKYSWRARARFRCRDQKPHDLPVATAISYSTL
jgi:hypothetical protein